MQEWFDAQFDTDALFDRYNGRLTLEQISQGIDACIQNTAQLWGDALVLMQAKRPARALSLLLMACQEAGKVPVLVSMSTITPTEQNRWGEEWKRFRTHDVKEVCAASDLLAAADDEEAFWGLLPYAFHRPGQRPGRERGPAREKVRQACLYVDFLGAEKRWWSPSEIPHRFVTKELDYVTRIVTRLMSRKEIGQYSPRALGINAEVVRSLDEMLLNQTMTDDERSAATDAARRVYWRRVLAEGVVREPSDDAVIQGKPWREYVYG